MPHCIIEHSEQLDTKLLINTVHQAAGQTGLFSQPAIKTRAMSYAHHRCDANITQFIHVNLKILPGRTEAQKTSLAEAVLQSLVALELTQISLTAEVNELPAPSYAKRVIEG